MMTWDLIARTVEQPVWLILTKLDQDQCDQRNGEAVSGWQRPPRPRADILIGDTQGWELLTGFEIGRLGHVTAPSMCGRFAVN